MVAMSHPHDAPGYGLAFHEKEPLGKVGEAVTDWNYADVFERVALEIPDAPCQVQGDRVLTWAQFSARSDALAAWLLGLGLDHQAKVAVYLRNCPEFIEAYVACFKAGLVPVNINFRYGHDELVHVFANADVEAVIFQAQFADILDGTRDELPKLAHFLVLTDGSPESSWADSYQEQADSGARHPNPPRRSGDDALLQYTGGTTGLPKGVLWRQDTAISALGSAANFYMKHPPASDLDDLASKIDRSHKRLYSACPLMHATGLFTGLTLMSEGWAVETSDVQRFSAPALLRLLAAHGVNAIVIVGDAFARPIMAEVAKNPDEYDLGKLEMVISAGSVWSAAAREAMIEHFPWLILCDNYGSSEALRGVQTYTRPGEVPRTGVIAHSELLHMQGADGQLIDATVVGNRGALLISGHLADGYYGDATKSKGTWITVDGVRYCVTGDNGVVEPDGSIRLLGRGNAVINTGGEKVYPQEVEEVIRRHEAVADAAVIGMPDERFGQIVTALLALAPGAQIDQPTLAEHVKAHLASYKAPRRLITVSAIPRTAVGKIDYYASHRLAIAQVAPGEGPVTRST